MPFYTYILQSVNTGRKYYGSCENIEKRLSQHNSGKVRSTKGYAPYKLLYIENFPTRTEALAREKYFKTLDGYNYLKAQNII